MFQLATVQQHGNELSIEDVLARTRVDGKKETNLCNQALRDYAEMGAARSLAKLHKQYEQQSAALERGDPDAALPPTTNLKTLQRWSAEFNFVSRADDYDRLIAEERIKMDAQRRIEEREQRRSILDKLREQVEQIMEEPDLMSDTKKFRAMVDASKTYMQASMSEYNDLPTQRSEFSTDPEKPIIVNFNTEPVAQSEVDAHVKSLGLAHMIDELSEYDTDYGLIDDYDELDDDDYSHLEVAQ